MCHERLGTAQQALDRGKAEYVEVALLLCRTGQVRGVAPMPVVAPNIFSLHPFSQDPLMSPSATTVQWAALFAVHVVRWFDPGVASKTDPLAEKVLALTVQFRQAPG